MSADEPKPLATPGEPATATEISEAALDAAMGGASLAAKPVTPRRVPPPSIAGEVLEGTGI